MSDEKTLSGGVVHDLPEDLEAALKSDSQALGDVVSDITPLARNEGICWIESADEVGDEAQADRLGLLKSEGWKAPALLLARVFASLKAGDSQLRGHSPISRPARGPGGRGGDLSPARKVRAPWNYGAG